MARLLLPLPLVNNGAGQQRGGGSAAWSAAIGYRQGTGCTGFAGSTGSTRTSILIYYNYNINHVYIMTLLNQTLLVTFRINFVLTNRTQTLEIRNY